MMRRIATLNSDVLSGHIKHSSQGQVHLVEIASIV